MSREAAPQIRTEIRTRRWNDPVQPGDGTRILVCRYRPRGVKKSDETWDEWVPDLGPSRELHHQVYSPEGLPWDEYRVRYHQEMRGAKAAFYIRALQQRVASGEAITLLCSSACSDENQCHRSLLKALIESAT
jgi:uncharacterized protein YeaO (DUF488 family)